MIHGEDEFYVGYMPMPARHRRFVRGLLGVLLLLTLATAALIASQQRDPGPAVWNLDSTTTFEGVIHLDPYPMLVVGDTSLLLVKSGKRGALERVESFNGRQVRVTGHVLARGAGRLLELSDDAMEVLDLGTMLGMNRGDAEAVILRGEIIDPKCYRGAMKPGSGKTHKACATLCLRGGIPPMFVEHGGDDSRQFLLIDADGRGLASQALEAIIPYVGDAVEIIGHTVQQRDLRLLHIERVRRL
jgi:hypothetical protein